MPFLLPEVINPEERRCVVLRIPDEEHHIAAFWGNLALLRRWFTWERDLEKQGKDVAAVWYEVIEEARTWFDAHPGDCDFMSEECCNDILAALEQIQDELEGLRECCFTQTRIIQDGLQQIRADLRNRFIEGDPTSVGANNPTVTWTYETGDTPEIIEIRKTALCAALERYQETVLADAYNGWAIAEGLIGAGVVLLLAPFPILGLAAIGITLIAEAWTADVFTDEDAKQLNLCCAYAALESADINPNTFANAWSSCGFDPMSNEELQRQALEVASRDEVNYIAFLAALSEQYTLAELGYGAQEDCVCEEYDWCETFDFTVDQQGFTILNVDITCPAGAYSAGNGFVHGDCSTDPAGLHRRLIFVRKDLPVAVYQRIRVWVNVVRGDFDPTYDIHGIVWKSGVTEVGRESITVASGLPAVLSAYPGVPFNRIELNLRSSFVSGSPERYSGSLLLFRVEVCGNGANPF